MVRLADHLAREQCVYPSPLIGCPVVLVLDLPEKNRGAGLALGRYYPIIIENEDERAELNAFFDAERPAMVTPDLLDHQPTAFHSDRLIVTRYTPSRPGWPWISLFYWPKDYRAAAVGQGLSMARGCYTTELFDTSEARDEHDLLIVQSLRERHTLQIQLISSEIEAGTGRA
ncbi:hypothetical protein CP98_04047 [Sphingobium yanoikuyae]|jgi:hypothetical protein|uniref:Uncharacterized protein n=1 Tax=Sphingobium yanoikuyae TaxID=13690 RepID=A0A084EF77_SPHYA|nr:hypothetical protein [Sphingomonas sp. 67-41]AYO75516.1 hypothetical protein EBF16_00475 [Sphingobium yanoikuyae]KEZ16619.1 hypothetical protein CP98_04047 [Sphingobium yanoikuyae]MDG5973220.1 hypothetical protein [Sphingomonas paucimobilis]OJY51804.1 MAG: hypothetical protein BGP17_13210 [Sphingomonas sp. 67-41]|tara:strand:+ start:2907 stop:3422 length:516 start_codon:yes stop_codon:yes gene_type:complete